MTGCPPPDAALPVAERLAGYLDCQAQALGQTGFANLSGGWFGLALLGGCLTIFIALIGYRLMLGMPFGPRDGLLAAARIGVVVAFATSWPAYEAVIYRVATDGPAEAAAQLLPRGIAPPTLPDAARRLDSDYASLQRLTAPGGLVPVAAPSPEAGPPMQAGELDESRSQPPAQAAPAQPQSPAHDPTQDKAWLMLVVAGVGALAAVRLAAGLLLGLGPVVIILALFDAARGLLEGWIRALLVVFVAAAGTMVVTGLELDFIEGQLAQANPAAVAGLDGPALTVTVWVFAAATLLVMALALIVGRAFRIPAHLLHGFGHTAVARPLARPPVAATAGVRALDEPEARARSLANSIQRLSRIEAARMGQAGPAANPPSQGRGSPQRPAPGSPGGGYWGGPPPRRTAAPPRTASAEHRDNVR